MGRTAAKPIDTGAIFILELQEGGVAIQFDNSRQLCFTVELIEGAQGTLARVYM